MSSKIIIFMCFVILVPHVSLYTQQEGDGLWPESVKIFPEKKEVMPGEKIEIILKGFKDPEGNKPGGGHHIIVQAKYGKILGGDNPSTLTGRQFRLGIGIVKVIYIAPTKSKITEDTITVGKAHGLPDDMRDDSDDIPFGSTKIGETKLTIIQHNIARIRYSHYYHNTQGEEPFTLQMEVSVNLHFEPLGGGGISIPYSIKSAAIMSFSGSAKGKDTDYTLVSAKPVHHKSALTVYLNQLSGSIEAVVFPRFSATLGWKGSEGYKPPESLGIGPVTKWDPKQAEKDLKTEAKKLEAEMKSGKAWKNMNRIMKIQKALAGVLVHPDFRVKAAFNRDFVSGEAKFNDSGDGWTLKKSITWDFRRSSK